MSRDAWPHARQVWQPIHPPRSLISTPAWICFIFLEAIFFLFIFQSRFLTSWMNKLMFFFLIPHLNIKQSAQRERKKMINAPTLFCSLTAYKTNVCAQIINVCQTHAESAEPWHSSRRDVVNVLNWCLRNKFHPILLSDWNKSGQNLIQRSWQNAFLPFFCVFKVL